MYRKPMTGLKRRISLGRDSTHASVLILEYFMLWTRSADVTDKTPILRVNMKQTVRKHATNCVFKIGHSFDFKIIGTLGNDVFEIKKIFFK